MTRRPQRTAIAALLALLPVLVSAAPVAPQPVGPPIGASDVIGFGASLVMVIGAVLVVGWLYARSQGLNRGKSSVINVLAAQPLGSKERIVLVEIGGKQIVVGMTAAQVSTLHVFDEPVVRQAERSAAAAGFAERLRAALKGVTR